MNGSSFDPHARDGNGRAARPGPAADGGHGPANPGVKYADGAKADPDPSTTPVGQLFSPGAMTSTSSGPSAAPSDESLLAAYRGGDKPAFAALVARYQRELYHFLVRFLGNRAAAEDVFQETFLQVHQSAEAFDPQRRFKPWLFTIAANKARDLIRSQARRPTNPLQASISGGDEEGGEFIDLMQSAIELPDEPMARQEMQQKVQRVVSGMPDHLREILVLSYFNTFPYRQIADILGIPLGTVKSRLHAAVATFADRWKAANRSRGDS
ncbi:MAG TPA: sigma-70 family RNA polymerase sigma factor [Humisphaera sp.]